MDLKLLNGLKSGDRQAFDALIRQYYARLMGYTRIMVDKEAASDIVQEVFLYVWEKRDRISFTPAFHSYLFKICHSRVVDYLRKNKTHNEDFATKNLLISNELFWLESNDSDIIGNICSKDLMERVEKLIEQLPARRREVFKLSFMHEMSNAEIADTLDMPRRTVESHLYLTLKFLRGRISNAELLSLLLLLAFKA